MFYMYRPNENVFVDCVCAAIVVNFREISGNISKSLESFIIFIRIRNSLIFLGAALKQVIFS